ncbi:hypothetical protein [Metallibacterium scheffleri]|uniref:hypothetical protein n=1 Tax=Metallibacterium scheffleri TaxID=993689 RepID=UPI0023F04C4F|nr:hypothetical protein [Metallibacterium scheffleri]
MNPRFSTRHRMNMKTKNATRVAARECRRAAWFFSAAVAGYWIWMGHALDAFSAFVVFGAAQLAAWYLQIIADNLEE